MKRGAAAAALLSLQLLGGRALHVHRGLARDAQGGPSAFPVSRVVQLLEDMKASLERDSDADEEIYEKMACWCTTNDKAKSKAIDDAEVRLSQLSSSIERLAAESATLHAQIASLEQEVQKNKASLEQAAALRTKQKAEFVAEEKEMVQSIRALDSAITVLSKHHSGAALASAQSVVTQVEQAMRKIQSHAGLLQGTITPRQKRVLAAFVQGSGGQGAAPYKPQSAEVFGILKQMKTTFEADLSESQKEELEAQRAFEELRAAKQEEIRSGEASLEEKQQNLARADSQLAEDRQEQQDTQEALAADQAFLADLKNRCAMTDQEWQARQKLRQDELASVAEAISILSSDDARDLFSKVYNAPSFLQLARSSGADRERAAALLAKLGAQHHDQRLLALAAAARLDAFERVRKAIDGMVAELQAQHQAEILHRDSCVADLNDNERWTAKEIHTKDGLEAKLDNLHSENLMLNRTIVALQGEVEELETQLQRARENRAKEHDEFQATLADQKAAEALLQQALAVIKSRYSEQAAEALQLAQLSKDALAGRQAPPEGFRDYQKSGRHATGVLALLEHIVAETQTLQQETVQAEAAAKAAFDSFAAETSASVQAKQNSIVDRKADKSKVEEDIASAKGELGASVDELEALSKGRADLKGSCDFFLQNFDVRQEARAQEIEALGQAKAYLSGMK